MSTIGISVKRGAMDTLMPSFMSCFSVSAITKVNRGPGERPALSPKTTPENKKVIRGAMG